MTKGTSIVGFLLSFVSGTILMLGIDRGTFSSATAKAESKAAPEGVASAKAGAVKVSLYVMSKCPYGVQAENAFKDVADKLGSDIDLKVDFIGTNADGNLSSMHGPAEVAGDTYQVCAMKYSNKWFDTVLCENKSIQGFQAAAEVGSNFDHCAGEAGIAPDALAKIDGCAQGQEGKDLLAASFQRSADRKATGSPTIYIGDTSYQGQRRPADFMTAICQAYAGTKPAACSDIPEAPKVNVTVLSDKRCAECNTSQLDGVLHQRIANPVITHVDYSEAAGAKLFGSVKAVAPKLPLVVFDSSFDADKDAVQSLGSAARQAGDYKVISAGDWSPVCDAGDGCDLAECKASLACRKETDKKLDVFVMSHCPYGIQGMDAMKEVVENFKAHKVNVDFAIHYIGDGDKNAAFNSMHGPTEVADDLREVCVIDKYAADLKYMDYVWCRDAAIKGGNGGKATDLASALADDTWQACAGDKSGFDMKAIAKCAQGDDGKDLLSKSFASSKELGIGASPTWLVNNKFKFSGIDAETVKTKFCEHNKVDGCDAHLSGPPAAQRPSGNGSPAAAPGCG